MQPRALSTYITAYTATANKKFECPLIVDKQIIIDQKKVKHKNKLTALRHNFMITLFVVSHVGYSSAFNKPLGAKVSALRARKRP